MALFSECRAQCAQTVLDTADIVRDGDITPITTTNLSFRWKLWETISLPRRNNAKAQTWKKQSGSLCSRTRLHGNEFFLWSASRQAGDDHSDPGSRGTRRHILRHRRGLRTVHK